MNRYKPLYWLIVTVFLLLFALTENWVILYIGGAVVLVYLLKKLRYVDTKTESIRDIGTDIPFYSVYAAKGLEFKRVLLFADDMNRNQKIVLCTRAMSELYFYE